MRIIDLHTHGLGGYDTRSTDVTHLLKLAELHGSWGTSEIVLTVYPATIPVMRYVLQVIGNAMQTQAESSATPAENGTLPARIAGVHLEGPFVNPAKAGALNAIAFLNPSIDRFRELAEGFEEIIRTVTVAPELPGALQLIRHIAGLGIRVNMGHSAAKFTEAEAGFHAGASGITHLFNAMSGFHHRDPGLAGFGLMNPSVYVEVIGDPYHLHIETIKLIYSVKPSDRILLISDTVRDTHAFLKPDAVTDGYGRLLGGGMTLQEAADRLKQIGINEEAVIKSVTENPARYLAP
ncbi:MAG TPA: hypothetical protein VK445_06215 [Dissulfurispiraceae bacterium]|nr:hypothetical protein [Dissulfurispiraceae bacterium]